MKTCIITGCLGQSGSYLTEHMLNTGHKVIGITTRRSTDADSYGFLEHLRDNKNFTLVRGDITDSVFMSNIISDIKPHKMANMAAMSHVGQSFSNPCATFEVNATSVVNMLSAIKTHSPKTRFYQASTSEKFGGLNCPKDGYTESSQLYPRSPYGVSKLAAYWSVINFREAYGLKCSSGILFNHESERRGLDFVTRKVTNGVARIKAGLETHITMGNLDAYRDWGYAYDYMKMVALMLDSEEPEEYVIATGKTHSIRDLVRLTFSMAGIGNWEDFIIYDDRFMRPSEVPYLLGNPRKANEKLGWAPETSFEELIAKMLAHDLRVYGL